MATSKKTWWGWMDPQIHRSLYVLADTYIHVLAGGVDITNDCCESNDDPDNNYAICFVRNVHGHVIYDYTVGEPIRVTHRGNIEYVVGPLSEKDYDDV